MIQILLFSLINICLLALFPPLILIISLCLFTFYITPITRNIFSAFILATFCIPSTVGFFSAVFEILSPDHHQFIFIYVIFALINSMIAAHILRNKTPSPILFKNNSDSPALLVFFATLVALASPFLFGSSVEKLSLASTGWDAGNHFMLFNYNLVNRSPSYLNNNARMLDVLQRYPQGLHTSMAMIISEMPEKQLIDKVNIFYFFSLFYCSAMMFFLTQILSASKLNPFIVGALGLLLYPIVGIPLMYGGFHTQIAGTAYLLAFTYVLILDNNKIDLSRKLLLTLLLAGVSMTWYFYLIIPSFAVASMLGRHSINDKTNRLAALLGTLLILPIPLMNLNSTNNDIMRLLPEKYHSSNTLLLPGGVYQYKMSAVLLVSFIFLLLGFIYFKHNSLKRLRLPAPLFWEYFAAFITLLSVSSYQLLSVGELRYYSYKLVFLVLPFAAIVLSWTLQNLLESTLNLRFLLCAALVAPLFVLSLHILFYDTSIRSWKNGNTSSFFSDQLLNQYHDENTVFISKCNPYSAAVANNWLNAIHLNTTVKKRIFIKRVTVDNKLQQELGDSIVSDPCDSN